MIRPSCLLCALKHCGQAAVLFAEARLGYPLHRHLAVGHLAEAESESLQWPGIAMSIREERIKADDNYDPDIMFLLQLLDDKLQELNKPKKPRKRRK